MTRESDEKSRTTALLGALALLAALIWLGMQIGAYFANMPVVDFTVDVFGRFMVENPVALTIPAAVIITLVYQDILEGHFDKPSSTATRLFKDRAGAIETDPDAQAREILAARQIN